MQRWDPQTSTSIINTTTKRKPGRWWNIHSQIRHSPKKQGHGWHKFIIDTAPNRHGQVPNIAQWGRSDLVSNGVLTWFNFTLVLWYHVSLDWFACLLLFQVSGFDTMSLRSRWGRLGLVSSTKIRGTRFCYEKTDLRRWNMVANLIWPREEITIQSFW